MCFPFFFLLFLVAFLDATGFFYLSRVSLSAVVIGFHSTLYCGFPLHWGIKQLAQRKLTVPYLCTASGRQYRYFFMDSSYFYVALLFLCFVSYTTCFIFIIIKAIGFSYVYRCMQYAI